MSKIWKQMLSLVLAMVMVFSTVPVQAFATETEPSSEPTSATEAPTEEPAEADDGTDADLPTDTPTVAPTEHTHEYASEVTTEADCTTEGVKTFTCACGDTYTETIPATGHTYENGVCACGDVEPTEASAETDHELAETIMMVMTAIENLPTEITSDEQAVAVADALNKIDEIVESDAFPADAYQALDWAKVAAAYDALDVWYGEDHSASTLAEVTDPTAAQVGDTITVKGSNSTPAASNVVGTHWDNMVKSSDVTCGKKDHPAHVDTCYETAYGNCNHSHSLGCIMGCTHTHDESCISGKQLGEGCPTREYNYNSWQYTYYEHTHSEPACYSYTWTLAWNVYNVNITVDGAASVVVEDSAPATAQHGTDVTFRLSATGDTTKNWTATINGTTLVKLSADKETEVTVPAVTSGDITVTLSSEAVETYSVTVTEVGKVDGCSYTVTGDVENLLAGATVNLAVNVPANTANATYTPVVTVSGEGASYADGVVTVGSENVVVTIDYGAKILTGNSTAEINFNTGMTTEEIKQEIISKVITGTVGGSYNADNVTVYYWPWYKPAIGSGGFCNKDEERRVLGEAAPDTAWGTTYYAFGARGADVQEKVVIEWNGLTFESIVTLKDTRTAPEYTIADDRTILINGYQKGTVSWPGNVREQASSLTSAVLSKITTDHDGTTTVEFKDENGDSWQTYAAAGITNAGNVVPGNNGMHVRVTYAATNEYPEMTVEFTVNYVESRLTTANATYTGDTKTENTKGDVTVAATEVSVTNGEKTGSAESVIYKSGEMADGKLVFTVTVKEDANFASGITVDIEVPVAVKTYNITWLNDDGSSLDTAEVAYDSAATHADASKTNNAQYTYTFAGWSVAVLNEETNTYGPTMNVDEVVLVEDFTVKNDATYIAVFTATTNNYIISWDTDGDGDVDTTTELAYGVNPADYAPAHTAKDGWSANGWSPTFATVTGVATYTAQYSQDTIYEVKYIVDGAVYREIQNVNATKGETVSAVDDPDKEYAVFGGWTNASVIGTTPTADTELVAQWLTDENNNNVYDEDEKATITVTVTGSEYGSVALSGSEFITDNKDGTYTVLFDSAVEGGNVITVTATPTDTGVTYSKNELVSAPQTVTVTDGETASVEAVFKNTTLTLNADATVYVNKSLSVDPVSGLKEKVLSTVVDGYANNADNYTVVVDGAAGDYDLDSDFSGIGGALTKAALQTLLRGNEAKVIITDKTTGLYGTVTVALADSRPTISITTSDVTIEAKEEPADVAQQVKNAVSIKATDPQTGAVTVVAVSDSYISYKPSYAWPADAEEKTFTVTVKVDSDATYIGASATLTLTCTDTTILYDVVYTDGLGNELYNKKHAENTATPTIEEPTRTYYTFAGWTPSVAETVTGEVTYTATWDPKLDNNKNNIADEEEIYTVIYTDGVEEEVVFADAVTENLAYGAATPTAPEVPTREGWNFKGWDVNPIPATVSAPTEGNTITYTAQWTEAWVVTFVGNTYNEPAEVENGDLVTEPTDTWDEDHDFLGWYNGEVKYDFTTPITSNLTLTAKWREDYNHNDIDDAAEAKYNVTYTDGVDSEEVFADQTTNVLVGLATPAFNDGNDDADDGNEPVRTGYIFKGWNPEVSDTVTNHVTYVAQWLNDTNGNDVDDALETITINVTTAKDADKITVTGATQLEGTNNWVYDSKTVTELTIKATPTTHLESLKRISDTYVKAITSQDDELELTYDANFAATATVTLTGPVAPIADKAAQFQTVEVTFAEAKFVYNTERVMNYHDKMTEVKNETLYNTVVDTPDLGESVEYTVTYKAREAMTHSVAIDNLDLNDTVKWLLKTITGKDTLTFDMPELWLEVDLEGNDELNEKIKNAVSLEQSVKTNLTSEKLLGLLEVFNDNGGLLGGGVSAAWNELQKILTSVTDAAIYYDAHVFGYNDTGAETVTEVIKVTYKSKALYIEGETDVTLKDMRATSYLNGSNVSVIYKDYTDEELAALIGAYVADANGTIIEDAEIVCLDITDPYSMEGSNVSDIAYKLTFTFDGDETYKPSKNTFTVTVTKASAKLELPNLIVEYGVPYDPIEQATVTLGNKYGEKSDITNSLIKFLIGLDVADLDVNADGVTGLNGQIQLVIPEDMLGVLSAIMPDDGLNMTLSDLTKFLEPLEDSSIAILKQALEAIQGITETGDIRININGKYPTDIGAYLYGAVSTNPNYETAFDVGYIVIKPDADRVYLDWNYNDTNGIFTPELLQHVNLGASAFNDEAFTAVNDTATDKINNLFFGININGELVAELYNQEIVDPETLENTLNNGAYTQMAFIAEFGNEMHYAVPIVRAFAIVPNTVTVTIVDQEDTDFVRTFDNEKQDLDVKLSYTGSAITPDEKHLTVTYTGIQTNTQVVESTDSAPIHAGIYLVTAFYNETDVSGKVIAVGADVKTLTIMPAPSETVVDDKIITKGETIDLMTDMIHVTVDSGVTSPDMTIISAQIASDGSFDEIGWDAVTGNVNIDVPDWLDAVLTEYAPEIKDGMNAAEFVEKLNAILPDILSRLEEAEASNEIINSLTNLVNNLIAALENVPDDATLTFNNVEDMDFDNVGVYVITAIVTDSDHMPSADSGLLVVQPDVKQVYLKWNYEDENGIWTRELLNHADLLATAYNEAEFITADANATAEITYKFIGVDKTGELKIFESSDANTLPNGAYIQLAYIEWESSGYMTVSDLLARPVVLIPGNAEVTMESKSVDFDNTAKKLEAKVVINGNTIDVGDRLTVTYTGVQTNGKTYGPTTVAPVHAGLYSVVAEYKDYTDGNSIAHYGVAAAFLTIEPAESEIAVTGGTVVYDGKGHTAAVKAMGSGVTEPDYTLISGGAYVSGDIDEVGVDAFHGNVNIDFPAWLDKALAEHEFKTEGVDTAYLIDFISSYRDDVLELIPVETLVKLGVAEEEINAYIAKLNDYIDELLAILEKLPASVALTFDNNVTYTEPGYYFYYGIVTDSDHYPAADTGLLVIEKKDILFDLLDTTVTWNGKGQMVDINNPENADYTAVVIDRKNSTINIILDEDAQYALNKIAEILGVEFDGDVQMSTILEKYSGQEVADAIVILINELEQLELPVEIQKVVAAIKAELETLPENGTVILNGQMPTEVGTYEVYAISYSQYFKTVASEAVLEIVPAKVKVSLDDKSKAYGDVDPELTYTVKYYDHKGKELTGITADVSVVADRESGEDIGTYAITAEVTVADTNFTIAEVIDGTLTITPKEITAADVKLFGTLTYNGTEQTQGIIVSKGITYEVTGDTGTNAGEYFLTVTGTGNYTGTVERPWTIAKADVKVAVDNASKVYGEDDPALTATTNGTFGSDVLDVKVSRAEGEKVGTYEITANVTENGNYNVTVVAGKLTITPATITVEVKDATKVYGEADPENKATITVTSGKVSESELNVVVTREAGEAAGEYAYKVAYTESDNYTVTVTAGKLTITEKEDDKNGLYPIPFDSEKDTTGTIAPGATVEIDGVPYILDENCIAWVDHTAAKIATTYKYHVGGNAHETYPTHMYVWYLTIVDRDSDGEYDAYTAERIEELDDFFKYEGTSIRINFTSNGIRFFTSVDADKCEALMNGTLLNGPMAGYQMTRTGTLYKKYTGSDSAITFANGISSDVYGGKAGNDFRVFSTVGSRNWFTGMLTGLDGDAETLDMDIQSRPFAVLELNGETSVLYGGTVQRSIYYVATQNRDYWATGTVYDNYVESLIATVEEARKKA